MYLEGKRKRTSFLLVTLLPLYVYIRTSRDVPLSELPQRIADTLFHRKSSFCCAEWCPLVAVEARLMVRPWTYICRRIEEVVYLEGKRKRTSGKHTHIPHYAVLHPHTAPIPHHSSYSTGRTTTTQKYTYTVCPKRHEIYFFAALLLVAACSNRLVEVGGPLSS